MTITAYDITTSICKSMTTKTGYTWEPLYGEDGEVLLSEAKDKLCTNNDYKLYFKIMKSEDDNPLTLASKGVIQSGPGWIFILTKKPYDSVRLLQLLFNEIGYVTELGGIGRPAQQPYTAGDLTVWKFIPVGGINKEASFFGKIYGIEQPVSFSVALTADIT